MLHLVLEDRVEGVTQLTAEFVDLLSQAAYPQIHQVEPRFLESPPAGAAHELEGIAWGLVAVHGDAQNDRHRRISLGFDAAGCGDCWVGAVGRDQVDH